MNFMETSINERFERLIITLYRGNKSAFAQAIGVAPSVVDNIVGKRQGKPSFDVVEKISAIAGLNLEWLITGKGEMLRTSPPHPDRHRQPNDHRARQCPSAGQQQQRSNPATPTHPNHRPRPRRDSPPAPTPRKIANPNRPPLSRHRAPYRPHKLKNRCTPVAPPPPPPLKISIKTIKLQLAEKKNVERLNLFSFEQKSVSNR